MAAQSRPTLILTRPAEAAARFAALVRDRCGAVDIVMAPLMAPEFRAPALPAHWAGVLFTSETGVAGLARLTGRRGVALCVGPRTAQAAAAAGWDARAIGGDAAGMMAALAPDPHPGLWLHARGHDAAAPLAQRLNAAGWQVREAIVYAQQPQDLTPEARAALTGDRVVLAVFSPRSAQILAQQAGAVAAPAVAVAISAAAAAPLAPLGLQRVVVAQTPDAPGMLDALAPILGKDGGA